MTKLSIVIPIYNAERWLKDCIDSILTQDYQDYEIILIDDGSTDGSGEICESFATEDNRIKVLHIENGGLGNARNVGIENAKGEVEITKASVEVAIKAKDEAEKIIDKLSAKLNGKTLRTMFSKKDRGAYAVELLTPIVDEQVKKRPHIELPDLEEMEISIRELLEEIGDTDEGKDVESHD